MEEHKKTKFSEKEDLQFYSSFTLAHSVASGAIICGDLHAKYSRQSIVLGFWTLALQVEFI